MEDIASCIQQSLQTTTKSRVEKLNIWVTTLRHFDDFYEKGYCYPLSEYYGFVYQGILRGARIAPQGSLYNKCIGPFQTPGAAC